MRLDFIPFDEPSCIKLRLKFGASAMPMDLIYGSSVFIFVVTVPEKDLLNSHSVIYTIDGK